MMVMINSVVSYVQVYRKIWSANFMWTVQKWNFKFVFNRLRCQGNYKNVKFYMSIKIFHQYIFHLPSFSLWAATFLLPWFGKWHTTLTDCQNCLATIILKCPWDQNFRCLIFFHFRVQCGYLTYLAKFQAITSIGSLLMGAVSFEISRPPLLCLFPEAHLKAWLRITGSDIKGSSRKLTWLISCRVLHWKQHHQRLSFMIKVVFRLIFGA